MQVESANTRRSACRRFRLLAAFSLGWAVVLQCGCDRGKSSNDAVAKPIGGQGCNLILVSLDTTRADHIGCYGHKNVKTPSIDRLAAEGTRFAQCVSPVPITLPSHATILTGSDPYVHGVRDNGTFVLSDENVTIAETLKSAGYGTHAIVGAVVLNQGHGLDQGFDTYNDLDAKLTSHEPGEQQDESDAAQQTTQRWAEFRADLQRPADEVTDVALTRLQQLSQSEQPFFLFIHYYDPHQPYNPPAPFRQQYPNDPYTGEIAFFDTQFGRLMSAVQDMGMSEDTLVVFLSDHGEGLGQHGEATHSFFVYDTTQLVPLILWNPGRIPAGRVIESQVRLNDVLPTVLDFLGQEPASQCQGQSLLPWLADPDQAVDLPAYAETLATRYAFGFSPLRCLRDGEWKYVHAPVPELYDLHNDPGEVFNLTLQQPKRAESMREALRQRIAGSPAPPGGRAGRMAIDAEEIAKLQALGYVGAGSAISDDSSSESGSELDDFEPVGANPRDGIGTIQLYADAIGAFESGKLEDAERIYRRLLEDAPDNVVFAKSLGDLLVVAKRYEEAAEEFRRIVKLAPDDGDAHTKLARLCIALDQLPEAEEVYRSFLEVDPTEAGAHLELANLLAEQQRYDAALYEYEVAAELNSQWPALYINWGMALLAAGNAKDAQAKLHEALRLNPEAHQARVGLAKALNEQGRTAEAIGELLIVHDSYPNDSKLMRRLGEWYSRIGDSDNSVKFFEKAAQIDSETPQAHFNLGAGLVAAGRHTEAIPRFREAIRLDSKYHRAWFALGEALEVAQRLDEAAEAWERCCELAPNRADGYRRSAQLLFVRKHEAEAIEKLRAGFDRVDADPALANDLAWCLATSANPELRDGALAIRAAERANQLTDNAIPALLDTLAAAYAEGGRYEDAVRTANRAIELAREQGADELASRVAGRAALYEQGKPFHAD